MSRFFSASGTPRTSPSRSRIPSARCAGTGASWIGRSSRTARDSSSARATIAASWSSDVNEAVPQPEPRFRARTNPPWSSLAVADSSRRPRAGLLAGDGDRREVALQDARHHGARDYPRLGDTDHHVGIVLAENLQGQRAAQLAEERPVHLEHAVRRLAGEAGFLGHGRLGRGRRRGRHGGRSYIADARGRKLFSPHGFLATPVRRLGCRRRPTPAPRLLERGARPRTPGRLRGGSDLVSAGAARSSPRRPHPTEHGDRAHQDAPHRRGDPSLPARARAGPRAGGPPLRARVPAAEARRPRRRDAAPAGVSRASPQRPGRPEVDRARQPGAPRPGRLGAHAGRHRGGALRGSRAGVLLGVLATAAACGRFGPDLNQVVAISVAVRDSVEELDTLRPHGYALDGFGDSVAATILWATLDTALLTVVNETTGVMVAKQPSATPARIQARVGNLPSNPIAIRVLAAADTLFAAGPTRDSVSLAARLDSLSDSLTVRLQDTTAAGPVDLSVRPVAFALTVYPGGWPGGTVAFVTA